MRRPLLGIIALMTGATLLVGCSSEDRAQPGDVIGTEHEVKGTETYVNVPAGRIDLTVTPRLASLDGVSGVPESAPQAPEGGGYIGIQRYMGRGGVGAMSSLGGLVDEVEPTTFTLVAGSHRYPLEAPAKVVRGEGSGDARSPDTLETDGPRSVYVAIEGDPEDISLEITYDGVTQSVDVLTGDRDPGLAAGMYGASAADNAIAQPECGTATPSGPLPRVDFDEMYCQVEYATVLVPYTSDLGWAPEERRWAVVTVLGRFQYVLAWVVTNELPYEDPQSTEYETVDFSDNVTLDGREPIDRVENYSRSGGKQRSTTYAWEVGLDAPLALRVRHTWSSDRIKRGNRNGPASVSATLDKTVTLTF